MMQVCRGDNSKQIILYDYFLLKPKTHRALSKVLQKMVIILRVIIVHQVQMLHHANALSNYCHHKIMPTLNAGRCVVKKQQIISMFHFWMSKMNMHELFSRHKNRKLFRVFLFLPVPFHKAAESFLSAWFILSNFPIARGTGQACRALGILIHFKLIHYIITELLVGLSTCDPSCPLPTGFD